MFRMEGGERECERGSERWSSSVEFFDAVYAAFRRSVSRCFAVFRASRVSVGVRALGFLTRCTQRLGALFRGVWRYIYS